MVTLAVSLSDGALASGALDGTIKIWDLHEWRVVKEMRSKGGADVPKDNVVQAEELSAYVSNLVRKLTDDSQQPVFSESGGKDFVIGTVRGTEPVPSASR